MYALRAPVGYTEGFVLVFSFKVAQVWKGTCQKQKWLGKFHWKNDLANWLWDVFLQSIYIYSWLDFWWKSQCIKIADTTMTSKNCSFLTVGPVFELSSIKISSRTQTMSGRTLVNKNIKDRICESFRVISLKIFVQMLACKFCLAVLILERYG